MLWKAAFPTRKSGLDLFWERSAGPFENWKPPPHTLAVIPGKRSATRDPLVSSSRLIGAATFAADIRRLAPSGAASRPRREAGVAVLAARDFARQGLPQIAEQHLRQLIEAGQVPEISEPSIASIWQFYANGQDTERIEDTIAWLRGRQDRGALTPVLAKGLVGLLAIRERPAECLDVLDRALGLRGSANLLLLRERVLRETLDRADDADASLTGRLSQATLPIEQAIELVLLETRPGRWSGVETERLLVGLIPPDAQLSHAQGLAVSRLIASRTAALIAPPTEPPLGTPRAHARDDLLGLMRWASDRGLQFSPTLHQQRLVLMAETQTGWEQLLRAARQAEAQHESISPFTTARAAQLLIGTGRKADAFALLDAAAFGTDPDRIVNTGLARELLRVTAVQGEPGDTERLIEDLDRRALVAPILQDLAEDGNGDRRGDGPAGLAYMLSGVAQANGKDDTGLALLRLALRHDPSHPWASNDLGYLLLLRADGDLEEAERLIETAVTAEPDEPSIIDSLGWLRYRQGRHTDAPAEPGGPPQMSLGSVSLLRMAAELVAEGDTGTVHAHLGDALWAAGEAEQAAEAWRTALAMAQSSLDEAAQAGITTGRYVKSTQAVRNAIRQRLSAAKAGVEPDLSRAPDAEGE